MRLCCSPERSFHGVKQLRPDHGSTTAPQCRFGRPAGVLLPLDESGYAESHNITPLRVPPRHPLRQPSDVRRPEPSHDSVTSQSAANGLPLASASGRVGRVSFDCCLSRAENHCPQTFPRSSTAGSRTCNAYSTGGLRPQSSRTSSTRWSRGWSVRTGSFARKWTTSGTWSPVSRTSAQKRHRPCAAWPLT